MATVTLIFNERKITKKGEVPLWLRITKDRKSKYVAIGVKIKKEHWDEDKMKVRKSHPNSQYMNNYIAKKISDAEGVALQLETLTRYTSPQKMKDAVMGRSSGSFIKYWEKYIEKLEVSGTITTTNKFKTVLAKLKDFLKNRDMIFDELTVSFLSEFETFLITDYENSTNTVHSNLKTIRKLVYDAVREEILTMDKNPFLKYKLHTKKTEKNFLTDEELLKMENLYLKPELKMNHHRNMYIFACYVGGLRISDVLQLKWKNFDGERIIIVTQKTDDIASIKVPNKAKEILKFYKTKDSKKNDFIFPILVNDFDYSKNARALFDAISVNTAYINKNLGKLATRLEINKKIHFHTSRHTFATRALRKGIPIEYVSKILTHKNISTTQIYAKIVNEELDKAMDAFND
jgi:integrase/recombinase XerD